MPRPGLKWEQGPGSPACTCPSAWCCLQPTFTVGSQARRERGERGGCAPVAGPPGVMPGSSLVCALPEHTVPGYRRAAARAAAWHTSAEPSRGHCSCPAFSGGTCSGLLAPKTTLETVLGKPGLLRSVPICTPDQAPSWCQELSWQGLPACDSSFSSIHEKWRP